MALSLALQSSPHHIRMPDTLTVTLSVTTFSGDPLFQQEGLSLKDAHTLSGVYLRNGLKGRKAGDIVVRIFTETE